MAKLDSIAYADPSSVADPSLSSSANTDHTTASNTKPNGTIEAIIDPTFHPTINKAPFGRKVLSYSVLLSATLGALVGARLFLDVEILSDMPLLAYVATSAVIAAGVVAMVGEIDWWELVLAYWWLSLPAAGAAGLFLVMGAEQTTGMKEVD